MEIVRAAKALLSRELRISESALKREFELDDDALGALVEELVDVQRVAERDGHVLSWAGAGLAADDFAGPSPATRRAPRPVGDEGERRQLTVMFCDLMESTQLSHRLDPEDLRDVVRAYQESASRAITRYEGHVAQYLGDGLLAYFGYPQAHEDDAERAVRSGCEILKELVTLNAMLEPRYGVRLATRVSVHTGSVVVGEMGSGAKTETLALGQTANIAARLNSVAEPGSVVISGSTLKLVPGIFVVRDLGSPSLKGVGEPIRAYAALHPVGVRSRLDANRSQLTPLVGRDHEIGLLLQLWEKVKAGEGQAALVSGEAGVGKSRLLRAYREQLASEPHFWLECACSAYARGSAFYPVIELLEQALDVREGDDPSDKLARLERGAELAGLSLPEVVPLVAPLLSIPLRDGHTPPSLSPELQRKKTIEAVVAWLLAIAEDQPLVLLFEDLQRCDPSTLELLGVLLERIPTANLLLLLTFRPDFTPPWRKRSHQTPVAVMQLSRRQAARLVAGMTPLPMSEELVQIILERGGGIPIFLEELTKMVLESGQAGPGDGRRGQRAPLTALAVPSTLQDLLMARLDRLDAGKPVAQLGAALGHEFGYELLRAVSSLDPATLDQGLEELVDAELLYQRGTPPAATYSFRHALIQDTAYGSLLRRVRQQIHARIAASLSESFPERVENAPEVVALHYAEAGLVAPAIEHYQRAGVRASQRSANREAIQHLGRAIELLGRLPEGVERDRQELRLQIEIALALSAARGWADAQCEAAFARATELASGTGEVHELPGMLVGLAASAYLKSDLATSSGLAKQALAFAEKTGDAMNRVIAETAVGIPFFWQGELMRALRSLEAAIEISSNAPDPSAATSAQKRGGVNDLGINARAYAGMCYWMRGQPDRGLATAEEAVAIARSVDQPLSLANALFWLLALHQQRREYAATKEYAEETIALSEKLGFPLYLGVGRAWRGWARVQLGGGSDAIAELKQGMDETSRVGLMIGVPNRLALLADAWRRLGQPEDAGTAAELGIARADELGQHYWDCELRRQRSEVLLELGQTTIEEAETQLRDVLELARRQGARSFELRTATSLARLLRPQRGADEARALLRAVFDSFTEGLDTLDLQEASSVLQE
jgi:class 3 adenylate cyclase/tetratricopeptide (TPR) repeat protein